MLLEIRGGASDQNSQTRSFVDFDHGINIAVSRIVEVCLGCSTVKNGSFAVLRFLRCRTIVSRPPKLASERIQKLPKFPPIQQLKKVRGIPRLAALDRSGWLMLAYWT